MKQLILGAAFLLGIAWAHAQNAKEVWSGQLELPGQKLTLVFHFNEEKKDTQTCLVDCIEQGMKNVKGVVDKWTADSVVISIPLISAQFKAVRSSEKMEGQMIQMGIPMPLTLTPGVAQPERSQEPKPPFVYPIEEVTFTNPTDKVTLAGTLTLPLFTLPGVSQKPVAVILISGSGQQDRNEELFGHKPFWVIADYLAKRGIAALRYDDRGVGQSSGDAKKVTVESNYRDAEAALHYLQSLKRFSRIGIIGHSEGGLLAMMLAADANPDFIVSLAGTGVEGKTILSEQIISQFKIAGLSARELDELRMAIEPIIDFMKTGKPITDPEAFVDKVLKEGKLNLNPLLKQQLVGMTSLQSPWLQSFLQIKPQTYVGRIKCPVLAINGELDLQVDATTNLSAIEKGLPATTPKKIVSLPGLNHLLQHARTGLPVEYGQIHETISPEVLDLIATWIQE